MAKKIDMTGWIMKEHGVPESQLTIIEEDKEYKIINNIITGNLYWKCKCDCGKILSANGSKIRLGKIKNCGHDRHPYFNHQKEDMTGWVMNEHGVKNSRWTIIEEDKNYKIQNNIKNKERYWKCRCTCGTIKTVCENNLRYGKSLSCGCLRAEKLKEKIKFNPARRIDLTGQKFGKLTVLGEPEITGKKCGTRWKCQCDCGNIVYRYTNNLKRKDVIQCCQQCRGEQIQKDLTNKRFGKLIALEKTNNKDAYHNIYWKCRCDCGNITYVKATTLIMGETKSCGCLQSAGNMYITQFLENNNIKFSKEYTFNDCLSEKNRKLRFDFCIYDDKDNIFCLLEYDGKQHFEESSNHFFKSSLLEIQERDKIKDNYCLINNIKLIRINYKENLQERLEEIFNEL